MSAVLLWFKRDLRLADHPALHHAMRLGRVVPVYVIEPELWAQPDASGRQYDFVRECLADLRLALRQRGSDLILRRGAAVEVLEALRLETGARDLVSHEETGNGWSFARDRAVAAWARGQGVRWHELPQCAVRRGPHDRDHWSAARTRWMGMAPLPVPDRLPPCTLPSDPPPGAPSLVAPDACPGRQRGGRIEARRLLTGFVTTRGTDYRRAMSAPDPAAFACSRLSPHIAFGTLSLREVVGHVAGRQCAEPPGPMRGALKSFQSRLAWRDHFVQKLEDAPAIETRCLHPLYEGLRGAPDPQRLQAWQAGETGLPFVDACMRSLMATGWLTFRARAMVMSVASYHLWLPWQDTGRHLARMFTDYEPGIHWSQCQMQSGTTGINSLRIYNPVKQGRDQDPQGAFVRRWCPEIAHLPDAYLHEPWRWEGRLDYPRPLVDPGAAARLARERIWQVRQEAGFAEDARQILRKHASRRDPQRHFVNDRAPARRRAAAKDDRQLRLDL